VAVEIESAKQFSNTDDTVMQNNKITYSGKDLLKTINNDKV